MKKDLIGELKAYRAKRIDEKSNTYGCCLFSCFKYTKLDKVNAAQFLIDLLEKNYSKDTIDQHLGALRNSELGTIIRRHAKTYVKINTVSELVDLAYRKKRLQP